MGDFEKGANGAHDSTVPGYDHGRLDMTGDRKYSIVVEEGAELYGDIHTVESEYEP